MKWEHCSVSPKEYGDYLIYCPSCEAYSFGSYQKYCLWVDEWFPYDDIVIESIKMGKYEKPIKIKDRWKLDIYTYPKNFYWAKLEAPTKGE